MSEVPLYPIGSDTKVYSHMQVKGKGTINTYWVSGVDEDQFLRANTDEEPDQEGTHKVQGSLSTLLLPKVERGSTFSFERSTFDFCLGGQRSFRAAQRAKRTVLANTGE